MSTFPAVDCDGNDDVRAHEHLNGDSSPLPAPSPVLSVATDHESHGGSSSSSRDYVDHPSSTDAIFAKWKDEANGVLLWLSRMPVDNIFPRPPPSPEISERKSVETLTVKLSESLPQVFRKLVLEGFLSAPVVDEHRKYAGFIDMLDLVVFTLKIFDNAPQGHSINYTSTEQTSDEKNGSAAAFDEASRLAEFSQASVSDAMRAAENELNPQHAISRGFSLFHAVEVMARTMAHRVAITDKQGRVSGILTQSMVISLLDQAMDSRFPTIASVPVSVLMADAQAVESIAENDAVINAFRKMAQKNVTGLPVVNAHGHLRDNISVRDLRGIGTDASKWRRLFLTVKEYKDLVRTEYSRQTPQKPIFVQPASTLAHVLKNTFDGNIYRVYVANACRTETGDIVPLELLHVITQRDVLRFVLFLTLRLRAAKRLIAWWRGNEQELAATGNSGILDSVKQDTEEAKSTDGENTIELAQVHSAQHAIHAIEGSEQRPPPHEH